MRHHVQKRILGRKRKVRKALLNSLARSLVLKEKIQTTEAKAKELRPFIEKLITKSKHDTVASRRLIASRIGSDHAVTQKLFETIGPRYKDRSGGYTRITKLVSNKPDARRIAKIEFV